jgi:rubrerythrin
MYRIIQQAEDRYVVRGRQGRGPAIAEFTTRAEAEQYVTIREAGDERRADAKAAAQLATETADRAAEKHGHLGGWRCPGCGITRHGRECPECGDMG